MEEYKGYNFFGPTTLNQLMEGVSDFNGSISFIAGGTDLVIDLRKGKKKPQLVVDLSQIPELSGVHEEDGRIHIGGATTFSLLARHPLILKKGLCLAQATRRIGSEQIRNRGTIGGNIASASPAGDCLPVLLVLEAMITIQDPISLRRLPLCQVLQGSGRTCLTSKEVITGIDFPLLDDEYVSGFEKIGSRTTVTVARLNMATVIKYDRENNFIKEARIALGALGETAFRLPDLEKNLLGEINPLLLRRFEDMLTEAVDNAITGRESHPYKREAIRGIAEDMFVNLFGSNSIPGESGRKHDQ
ncbi:FAD binding domain-containing protein [Desulfosporosinus fructosivorans]